MTERKRASTPGSFVCALLGLLAFLLVGSLASLLLLFWNNYIVVAVLAGGIGCLLLGLLLRQKGKIARMTIAGTLGLPLGIAASFGIVEGAGALLPFPDSFAQSGIPDVIAICLMGIVFGAVLGGVTFGGRSIFLFSIVCGVLSVPFGFLVVALNKGLLSESQLMRAFEPAGRLDLNLLAILLGLGIGAGLSIGLHVRPRV